MRICCTLASEVFTVLVNDVTFYGTYKCNGRLDGPALTGMLGGPQPPTRTSRSIAKRWQARARGGKDTWRRVDTCTDRAFSGGPTGRGGGTRTRRIEKFQERIICTTACQNPGISLPHRSRPTTRSNATSSSRHTKGNRFFHSHEHISHLLHFRNGPQALRRSSSH